MYPLYKIWATKIAEAAGQPDKAKKYTYALELLIGEIILKPLSLLVIGYITGNFLPMIVVIVSSVPLRMSTGGGHCSSSLRCWISTALIFSVMAIIGGALADLLNPLHLLIIFLITIVTMALVLDRFGPGHSVNHPVRTDEKIKGTQKTVYGMLAVYILIFLIISVFVNKNIESNILAPASIGIAWQTLMITPVGNHIITAFDKTLVGFKIK